MKKKVLAIAIALVLVCSMGAAFAQNACFAWEPDWSCTTAASLCGKGKVEVVPLVKVNTSCGYEFQESSCATAMKDGEIYFAIKLTVDANPDPAWWQSAVLDFESTGIAQITNGSTWWNTAFPWKYNEDENPDVKPFYDFSTAITTLDAKGRMTADFFGIDYDADKEKVYYASPSTNLFVEADDAEFATVVGGKSANVVFTAKVNNYASCTTDNIKVCAKLTSEYDGLSQTITKIKKPYSKIGDYLICYSTGTAFNADDELNGVLAVFDKDAKDYVKFTVDDGAIVSDTGRTYCSESFYTAVMRDFGFANCGVGACLTEKTIQKNFGWDEEQESCFSWSDKGTAVVDPQCVVEIPKTGDVSVIAYAVMALVAAAGAMGLKK